ncbi:MAG TPA: LysR family transcriptional regulator [Xanthobacteraceae bacterium]|nr:LysR family transcriptional regulator [Xanthobacteraceae bacterium]
MTERNLRGIDLNLLVVFDALMAERHVTRAARHNGLSQPAMSKALNRLRHLLDDRLFERREGRMEPTPRALELAGPIHSALSDISRTLTLQSPLDPRQIVATLRIATIDLHQTTLLPALVAALRRDAPGVDIQVRAIERHRLHDQLAMGELDLAIAPPLVGMRDLRAEPLWMDHLVTLIGADNPIALPMTLDTFAAAPHVVDAGHVQVAPDGQGTSLVDSILAERGLRRRIAVVLPSSAGVPFVVAATDLIATLPNRIIKDLATIPEVRVIPAPLPRVEVSPHIIWHPRTQNAPLCSWLRAVIKQIAAVLEGGAASGA